MSECVFCDRANFENRIIAENDRVYIVATLGQITPGGHVLVFPKKHVRCMGDIDDGFDDVRPSLLRAISSVSAALATEHDVLQDEVSLFEHGIAGQTVPHAHVHVVPSSMNFAERIKKDFPSRILQTFHTWEDVFFGFQKTKKTIPLVQKR